VGVDQLAPAAVVAHKHQKSGISDPLTSLPPPGELREVPLKGRGAAPTPRAGCSGDCICYMSLVTRGTCLCRIRGPRETKEVPNGTRQSTEIKIHER
jgi:hypothetical protein